MLVLITIGTPRTGILQLQEVRLRQVNTSSRLCLGILLLIGLTYNDVSVMQANGTIVSKCILNQCIGVLTMSLGKALVLLSQIYAVTLNPCRNPGLIITRCGAI